MWTGSIFHINRSFYKYPLVPFYKLGITQHGQYRLICCCSDRFKSIIDLISVTHQPLVLPNQPILRICWIIPIEITFTHECMTSHCVTEVVFKFLELCKDLAVPLSIFDLIKKSVNQWHLIGKSIKFHWFLCFVVFKNPHLNWN